ncbi:MAG: mandelate racemase/muconate lactonizing enzyme family protein, partial [Bulleidia sp.]
MADMKITEIEFLQKQFPFEHPFRVSFAELTSMDTCFVKIHTDEGMIGIGEAAPLPFVTGDNLQTILAVGEEMKQSLIGIDPMAIGTVHQIMDSLYAGSTALKAGIDLACYDLSSKKAGVPLYRYLGGSRKELISDITIGIDAPEAMAEEAVRYFQSGFGILKIKLGSTIAEDVERVRAIRNAVGADCILRVDANQGWSVKDAIRASELLDASGVDLIE